MRQSDMVDALGQRIGQALRDAEIVDISDGADPSVFLVSAVLALALAIATHGQDWEAIDD